MKDWIVTFDEDGEVLTVKDVTASPPRRRILPVRASSMAAAIKAAKALYSLAQ
jgi:hypothetical protein